MIGLSLAQHLAHEPDEFKVFQACVKRCMAVSEVEWVMDEWNTIRAGIEGRVIDDVRVRM